MAASTLSTYYNDNEPFVAEWLRNLSSAGHISHGVVDERSIHDISPRDLSNFERCHFFAGIGGWDLALQLAGWPSGWPVWTGSCPCQPFSAAGKRQGMSDERHLWPEWFRLIRSCRPGVIFGEQVDVAIRIGWLDRVFDDLEAEGYACGAVVLPAASVGAPHIRHRIFWVADTEHAERRTVGINRDDGRDGQDAGRSEAHGGLGARGEVRGMALSDEPEFRGFAPAWQQQERESNDQIGFWFDSRWHYCRDGKYRRVPLEPSLFPLAHGIPNRVGLLRGAGNAIVPQVAALLIRAYLEATP